MSNKCDIIPQILSKNGEWVDSLLFTSLLENLKDRELAKKVYEKVHSKEFHSWFGSMSEEELEKVIEKNFKEVVDNLDIDELC